MDARAFWVEVEMRRKSAIGIGVLLWMAATTVAAPAPTSAELVDTPTTSWGVSGLATGTFTDSIKSEVWAIEQIGDRVFVGGRFTQTTDGNQSSNQAFLAAFDATTGVYDPSFAPQLDNAVFALEAAPDGSRLFVAGSFENVNGLNTGGLVALDPATGNVDGWGGRIGGYNLVRNLDLVGNWLYVAGSYDSVSSPAGNNTAWGAARFDWQDGNHDSRWRPVVDGGSVWGIAASELADRVYLAGAFDIVNGESRPGGFAAVNASDDDNATGVQPFQFNTASVRSQYLYDVVTVNGLVFAGGSEHFVQVLAESDLSLVEFHISEPNRGDYQDLEVVGDRVYAGCHCTQDQVLNSAEGIRWFGQIPAGESNAPVTDSSPNSWVMALSATTGDHIDTFVPDMNSSGPGIWAIHGGADGCVWFGGNITKWSGVTQRNLSRICEDGGPGGDTERPTVPGKPQIQNIGPDTADLNWNPSTDNVGVTGYRIYDNNTGNIVLDTPTNNGTITGLAPGTYQLYTKAYDAAGNLSYRSGFTTLTITGTGGDTERPSTPTGLTVSGVNPGSVDLTWNPSTDNVGVAGYRVFDNATGSVVADVPSTTANVVLPAGTYTLFVKAYDAAGNLSYRTNLVTVTL